MAAIKVSSKVDATVWRELQAAAEESDRTISGLLTDAIREYLARRRVRPELFRHLDASTDRNDALGRLLAE